MKPSKVLRSLLILALIGWAMQAAHFAYKNAATPARIKSEGVKSRNRLELDYTQSMRELEHEYEKQKKLATGETVYDRIFNTQEQSILDLTKRISQEALPEGWTCDVKVEEFTHFILLIYVPHNSKRPSTVQIASYLQPIAKYCGWCLANVAVFDKTHKSYLFFDRDILDKIRKGDEFSHDLARRTEELGGLFTRFNSITIECEKQQSHLWLPVEVISGEGMVTCYALFDTGASTTMLSVDVISKTGYANFQSAPRRRFSTANGLMTCPIVSREVSVGGFRRTLEVAVNERDELNLLGVNFFDGMDYIADFQNSVIYMWEQ